MNGYQAYPPFPRAGIELHLIEFNRDGGACWMLIARLLHAHEEGRRNFTVRSTFTT